MTITLRIDPPLPCAVRAAGGVARRCGQPATIAQADALPDGSYTILPICRDCVAVLARLYGVTADERSDR